MTRAPQLAPMRRHTLARLIAALLPLAPSLFLAACGTVGSIAKTVSADVANAFTPQPAPAYLDIDGLTLAVDADANNRSALAVDLVYVKDLKTLEQLRAMSASKWFASRDDVLRTYPDALSVRSMELVPRQVVRLDRQTLGSPRVAGVVLFANYRSPGEHRALIPELRAGGTVRFGATGFEIVARNI